MSTDRRGKHLPYDRVYDPLRGHQFQLACAGCDSVATVSGRTHLPAEIVIKKFKEQGWYFGKGCRKPTCPKCLATPKSTKRNDTMSKIKPIDDKTPPAPTPGQQRALTNLLESHFEEAEGHYLNGYSDDRIAEEVKIAPAVVANFREAAFGPLKAPAELLALKSEVDSLGVMVTDVARKLDKALKRYA